MPVIYTPAQCPDDVWWSDQNDSAQLPGKTKAVAVKPFFLISDRDAKWRDWLGPKCIGIYAHRPNGGIWCVAAFKYTGKRPKHFGQACLDIANIHYDYI